MAPKIKKRKPKGQRQKCFACARRPRVPVSYICLTCKKLAAAAKIRVDEIFTVRCCAHHANAGLEKIKKHALVGHR